MESKFGFDSEANMPDTTPVKTYRTYTSEFKQEAVRLAQAQGVTKTAVDLGIHPNLLGRWMRIHRQATSSDRPAFPGRGQPALTDQERRIQELERENAVLRHEREILKAAAKFFALESR